MLSIWASHKFWCLVKCYYCSPIMSCVHLQEKLGASSEAKTGSFLARNWFFPKWQILDSFKLKEFAEDNFKFDYDAKKFSNKPENTVGKGEIACYKLFLLFSMVLSKNCTAKDKGLFGKGLKFKKKSILKIFHILYQRIGVERKLWKTLLGERKKCR